MSLVNYLLILVPLYTGFYYLFPKQNNVCKTFTDYYFPGGNENCYYDPDTDLETPQLIEKYTGKVEIHKVTSEDGYIITLFRMVPDKPKGVILFHHSIAANPRIYLWQANDSLAVTLWRNGFDVWLANQRGIKYSDEHVNMTSKELRYWNFSFHEMGLHDVSSELKLINEKTNGSKVIYFGHSLGAAIGLVYASLKPKEAETFLKTMVFLGTPYKIHRFQTLSYLSTYILPIYKTFHNFSRYFDCLFDFPASDILTRAIIRLFPPITLMAAGFSWFFCGYTPLETDPAFFNFCANNYMDNFSWKTVLHFKNEFSFFDYDPETNIQIYGSEVAPPYPIEQIMVPSLMISSSSDTLTTQEVSEELYEKLSPVAKTYGHWKLSDFNHIDFLLGLNRKAIFTNKFVKFLNSL